MRQIQTESYFDRVPLGRGGKERDTVVEWQEAIFKVDLRPAKPPQEMPQRTCSAAMVRLVLLTLRRYMSLDGTNAFPCHATIAKAAGVSRSTVIRALRQAEQLGWVKISHERGRLHSNLYRAAFPADYVRRPKCVPQTDALSTPISNKGTRNKKPVDNRYQRPDEWEPQPREPYSSQVWEKEEVAGASQVSAILEDVPLPGWKGRRAS